jgi:dehydrogenase/reductase SDR family protein 4
MATYNLKPMNNHKESPYFSLKGKSALITGASKGIGLAIATAYLQQGARVMISSRDEESLKEASKVLSHPDLYYKKCHVGVEADRAELVDETIKTFGKIDILVNNAAINPAFGPLHEQGGMLFDKIMDVNVKAPLLLSNLVFPHMKKSGGSIIHISSVEAVKPSPGLGLYSVSKAALSMLTKTQAKEWGPFGIRVNAILPGLIKTKFSAAIWQSETFLQKWTSKLPLQRMAEPGEIAGLAVFLGSEASSYCTGAEYIADGGYLLQ